MSDERFEEAMESPEAIAYTTVWRRLNDFIESMPEVAAVEHEPGEIEFLFGEVEFRVTLK